MAIPTTGSTFGLSVLETTACRMLAYGASEEDVMEGVLKIDMQNATPGEKQGARKKLHKMMAKPGFQACYEATVQAVAYTNYGRAASRLFKQIDDKNGWLANKAANDVLTRYGPYVTGRDNKEVVIRIEGAPVMGTPEE